MKRSTTRQQRSDVETSISESLKHQQCGKTLSPIRTTDQALEEDLHPGEGEGEEDPRNSQTTTQEIYTSTASIMKEVIAPKGAQKPRRTLTEFSKRRQ
jgi:hypothetical protein